MRYHGQQPNSQILALTHSQNNPPIEKVTDAVSKIWNPTTEYWPIPSELSEKENDWWVKFSLKEKVVLLNGKEVVQKSIPGVITFRVNKTTYECIQLSNR